MSFWDDNNYKVRLVDFVERFVAHNSTVMLYTKEIVIEDGLKSNKFNLIWRGMDWQITEEYADSDYFKAHTDVLPCPYGELNVVALTSAGISGDFTDDVSLIVEG